MSDLSDPEKFQMVEIVTKNSKSRVCDKYSWYNIKQKIISDKERTSILLFECTKKFQKYPIGDVDNIKFLDAYQELPKCSIEILNIKKINGFENNSNYFSIEFEARHMMEREDIRKTMTLEQFNFAPKNTKQMITWQFTCDNQFVKQKWVNALETLHAYYSKEKINIQKFFENINKREEQKYLAPAPMRSSLKVPWRDEQIKKSGSNESLRKSNLPQGFSNRSPSSTKKSVSSEQRNEIQDNIKNAQPESDDIVKTFMEIDKMNKIKSETAPKPSVIQQSVEQSFQSPNKFGLNTAMNPPKQLVLEEKEQKLQNSEKVNLVNPIAMSDEAQQQHNQQQAKEVTQRPAITPPQSIKSNPKLQTKEIKKKEVIGETKIEAVQKKEEGKPIQIPKKQSKQIQVQKKQIKNQTNPQKIINPPPPKQIKQKEAPKQKIPEKPIEKPILKQPAQRDKQQKSNSPKKLIINKLQQELKIMSDIRKKGSLQSKADSMLQMSSISFQINSKSTFYELLYFSHNREYSFDKRIEAQEKLNALIGSFTEKAVNSFSQFVQSKSQKNRGGGRFSEHKIDDSFTTLEIGYTKYKIGYVNTQGISINNKQRIYYNESAVKSLKKQMNAYNQLHTLIVHHLKNLNNSKNFRSLGSIPLNTDLNLSQGSIQSLTKSQILEYSNDIIYPAHIKVSLDQLRVPFCTYMEYKGICAMAYDETHTNGEKQLMDKEKLNEWRELIRFLGFNSNYFQFKTIKTNVGELVIAYITQANTNLYIQKQSKHHNVTFESPMTVQFLKKAKKEGASLSVQSILRYIKGMKSIKDTKMFTCPREEILATLEYCYLCKYLRKFYRAAQGEIDQLNFVNLLLKGDYNISKLFETSGFEMQSKKGNQNRILGIFFQFLLYYLGIWCEVDAENFTKYAKLVPLDLDNKKQRSSGNEGKIVKSVKIYPRVVGYDLNQYELYESFNKIGKYIANNNKELASRALEYEQNTYIQNQFQLQTYPWPASTQYLLNSAELNFIQNDYITSISKSKQFLSTMTLSQENQENQWQIPTPSNCLHVYFLMLKCYSKFSLEKYNEILKQTIESTMYNFGQNSSMIVTLFSFSALAYYGMGDYSQAEMFLRTGIKTAQKIYHQYKKLRLSQLYLDLHKILLNQSKVIEANQYLTKAEKIIQTSGNYQEKFNFLLYQLELQLKSQKALESEEKALKNLYKAQTLFNKQLTKIETITQYYHLAYKIGIKFNKSSIYEKSIQQLWHLDTNSKNLAIELAYRLIGPKYQGINSEYNEILERWSLSKEKSILIIEQNMKHYKTLSEMMNEVFIEEEKQLISAFFKLLPPGVVRSN